MNTPRHAITPSDQREFVDAGGCAPPVVASAYSPRGTYRCPPWAHWLAVDSDGTVWAYAHRPQLQVDVGCWAPFHATERFELIDHVPPTPAWRDSLVAIPGVDDAEEWRYAAAVAALLIVATGTFTVGTFAGWW